MQLRAEVRAFKIEVLALAARTRREWQSRSGDDEPQRARFHDLEAGVERLEGRVDALEARIDRIEIKMRERRQSDDDAPGER
jgi:hypothetical protein